MRIILLSILFLVLFQTTISGKTTLNFHEISLNEGLSHTSVHDIHRDYKGILWIGTSYGLNRYDGNEMRQYFTRINDTTALPGNHIYFIQEDKDFNLWIGTDRSVVRYDREKDCFVQPSMFKNLEFKACYSLEDRILFFGADRLITYQHKAQSFDVNFYPAYIKKISLSQKITKLDAETLLIGTRWKGIFRYDLKTGDLTSDKFHQSQQITALCVDRNETIWLSSYAEGLFAYAKDGTLLRHYTTQNSGLGNNIILDIQEVSNGDIWIATDGSGISILNYHRQFDNISAAPNALEPLPIKSISRIYEDNNQTIWIGTVRAGCIGTKLNSVQSYTQHSLSASSGMSARIVTSFYEDEREIIWIGTDGNGINRFNPKEERFQHYPSTFKKKITSIARYSNNELLLSYFGEGLQLFNIQTGQVRDFAITKILERNQRYAWISTNLKNVGKDELLIMGENLYLYSISEHKLNLLNTWTTDSLEVGLYFIREVDSLLYLYSPTKIFSVNKKRKSITLITDVSQCLDTKATAVVQDFYGNFWIASEKGLWRYNPKTNEYLLEENNYFKRLTTLAISSDSALWIGAANKIYCFRPEKHHFDEYDVLDGVQPNIYIPKANCCALNGDLYFGGVNGFQRVITKEKGEDSTVLSLELIELLLNGELFTGFSVNTSKEITLPSANQTVDIRLLVKAKHLLRQKTIRYQLEGLTNDFIITTDSKIRFTKLPPGKYRFNAQIYDGAWDKYPVVELLTITVLPFWWQTWWFRLSMSILILILLYFFWYYYRQVREKEIQKAMSVHEKQVAEQKIQFLININHELRTPLTLISAPLERLLKNDSSISSELKKTLTSIYKQAKQMRNVIDMVLDFRKMELTPNKLKVSYFDFNMFVQDVLEDFRLEYSTKGVELLFESTVAQSLMVNLDKEKCHNIINNLLANALKFSSKNERVSVEVCKNKNTVTLRIIDEGIGLNEVDMDKIFTRFYQANHNLGGFGIGISFSKSLAEMMGGCMGCAANATKGATFWVELPIDVGESSACDTKIDVVAEVATQSNYITEVASKDYTILKDYVLLIVEDEKDLNKYLRQELTPYFKKVYVTSNGTDGLKIIKESLPDCIISDVMMPQMNGYELCNHVKSNLDISHIPVILLTARADEASIKHGYKVGADAYLAKPFSVEALLNLTINIFSLRRKMQEHFRKSAYAVLPEKIPFNNEEEEFVKKMLEIIEEEISNPELDVDTLVERMAVSRSTLYAKMKSLSGTGVKDFINEIRIKKAKLLLVETELPVVEISEKVGYSQQRYFSTVFKQYTQMTPTQYRAKNGK
ncbi:MAG: two-component regulator propeller domain-containing protein [Bacteroidales bacterium]